MAEYNSFVNSMKDEIAMFRARQAEGVAREETRYAPLCIPVRPC